MIFCTCRSTRRTAARAIGSIYAAAGFIVSAQPASAQLGATFLATPQGKRLTQQERADLEQTQIAPDFQLYREWIYCLNETARSSLDQGSSVESATSLMSTICQSGELDLRASLARSVGLARARRIIAILYANKLAEMKDRYTKIRTPALGTLGTIQGWSLMRHKDGCMAVSRSQGPLSLQTQVIRRTAVGYPCSCHVFCGGSQKSKRRRWVGQDAATHLFLGDFERDLGGFHLTRDAQEVGPRSNLPRSPEKAERDISREHGPLACPENWTLTAGLPKRVRCGSSPA